MISVVEARRIVVSRLQPLPAESVSLQAAGGRVLAADVVARISHPATAVSSMDGYAVKAEDVASPPATLRLTGIAAAGSGYAGAVRAGEAVRILTGAPLPDGADSVVIQEHARLEGDHIIVRRASPPGRWIRPAAMDFQQGETLLRAGRRLTASDLALAAAANVSALPVHQRPRVAFLATGSELVLPGEWRGPAQTINSNSVYLGWQLQQWGAVPVDLGVVADDRDALAAALEAATGADLILTVGGASVGDRDLVRPVLADLGFSLGFERVAMRPGKPTSFGWLQGTPVLILPGNPVSAAVTTLRLAQPMIAALLGATDAEYAERFATLGTPLPANDEREDYIRARLTVSASGRMDVTPFARQDSALTALFAAADCLILRAPHAPPVGAGDIVPIILLH